MDRKRVLLLFGGESSEHDVSISSARNVYAAIDDERYEVTLGYIDRHGKWWLIPRFDREIDVTEGEQIAPLLGNGGFVTVPGGHTIKPDVVFPILHGHNGEDGSVQGMLRLAHVPFVGCDMTASAVAMDKLATKEILQANNIQTAPYWVHRSYEPLPDFGKLTMQLGNPVFVKPARSGSSVGVSKVHTASEFADALEDAHRYDTVALIEQAVIGQELEVAMLGNPPEHQVSGVGEVIPGDTFYSYDDKYAADSAARVTVDAAIDDAVRQVVQDTARHVYEILGCEGLARVDFLLSSDGELYVLEVNTIPGFTNISMYPKLWRAEGMAYSDLITRLIEDATR